MYGVCPSSVRLSVPSVDRCSSVRRVCCCGPRWQEISISCCTASVQQQRRRSNGAGQQQRIAYAVSVLRRCVSDVCLYQGQRAWQQQSRAAAGDAHRRLHMTRGRVNFGPTNTVRRDATVLLRRSDCVGITDCVSTEGKAIGRVRLSVCFRSILF